MTLNSETGMNGVKKDNGLSTNPARDYTVLRRRIALVAAIVAAVICTLILINYIQLKRTDPLNLAVMQSMVDRLQANPDDDALREEIRQLDLLSRRAFFTSQWQIRVGGYLLFISLLIVVITLKYHELTEKILPSAPGRPPANPLLSGKLSRSWIFYSGIGVVIISFFLIFMTHRDLDDRHMTLPERPETAADISQVPVSARKVAFPSGDSAVADTAIKRDSLSTTVLPVADGFPTEQEVRANFPAFRGPGGLGIAYQKNIPTSWDGKSGKNIRWKTVIPLPGYNSPVIWDQHIFLTGADAGKREVYCISLTDGKILWTRPVDKIPVASGREPKVTKETGYSAPTMTTDGRRVYAIFANGDLIAFDFSGNRIWAKNLGVPQNHYGHSSSLIMYRNLLIVQYDQRGSASVMALDGKTGDKVWETQRKVNVSWASPVLIHTGNRMELVLAADPSVISYDPANGKELWQMECISGEVGPSVAYAGGIVFSVNDYSKLAAIEAGQPPKLLWEDTEYLSDIPSPLATDKYLFLVTSFGTLVCYDAKTGTRIWEHDFSTPVHASPMLAEGRIYLMAKSGIMHIIRASAEFETIAQPALGEGSSCTPAFADGRIIIRGDKNLYCIGK